MATTFAKIAPARARQLFNWNRILSVLHAAQAVVIVAISPTDALVRFEGTYPVSKIVDGQFAGLSSAKELLFSFPLAYLVAAFFGLSATGYRGTILAIAADTAPALRFRYDPAAVPPWRKALWRDPEAVGTGPAPRVRSLH